MGCSLENAPVEDVAPQLEHVGEVPLQAGGEQEDTLRHKSQRSGTLNKCLVVSQLQVMISQNKQLREDISDHAFTFSS